MLREVLLVLCGACLVAAAGTAGFADTPVVLYRPCTGAALNATKCYLVSLATSPYSVTESPYLTLHRSPWYVSWQGSANSNTNRFCIRLFSESYASNQFLGSSSTLSALCSTTWSLPIVTVNGVTYTVLLPVGAAHSVNGQLRPRYLSWLRMGDFASYVAAMPTLSNWGHWIPIPVANVASPGAPFCLYTNGGFLTTTYDALTSSVMLAATNSSTALCTSLTSSSTTMRWIVDSTSCLSTVTNPPVYVKYSPNKDYYVVSSSTCETPLSWVTTNMLLATYTFTAFTTLYSPNPSDSTVVNIFAVTGNRTAPPVWQLPMSGSSMPVVTRSTYSGQCFVSQRSNTALSCGTRVNGTTVCPPTAQLNCSANGSTPANAAVVPSSPEQICADCDSCRPSYTTSLSGYYLGTLLVYIAFVTLCIGLIIGVKTGLLDLSLRARIRIAFAVSLFTDVWEWGLGLRAYLLLRDWLLNHRSFPVMCNAMGSGLPICALATDSDDADFMVTMLSAGISLYLLTILIFSGLRYALERIKAKANEEEARVIFVVGAILSCARLGFGPITRYLAGIVLDNDCLNINLQGSHDELLYFCIFGGIIIAVALCIFIAILCWLSCTDEEDEDRNEKANEYLTRFAAFFFFLMILYLLVWGVYEIYVTYQEFSVGYFLAQFFSVWAITPTIQLPYAVLTAVSSGAAGKGGSTAAGGASRTAAKQGLKASSTKMRSRRPDEDDHGSTSEEEEEEEEDREPR